MDGLQTRVKKGNYRLTALYYNVICINAQNKQKLCKFSLVAWSNGASTTAAGGAACITHRVSHDAEESAHEEDAELEPAAGCECVIHCLVLSDRTQRWLLVSCFMQVSVKRKVYHTSLTERTWVLISLSKALSP